MAPPAEANEVAELAESEPVQSGEATSEQPHADRDVGANAAEMLEVDELDLVEDEDEPEPAAAAEPEPEEERVEDEQGAANTGAGGKKRRRR
jgi:hypothetical protein